MFSEVSSPSSHQSFHSQNLTRVNNVSLFFFQWPESSATKYTSIACLFRLVYWSWQTTQPGWVIQHNSPLVSFPSYLYQQIPLLRCNANTQWVVMAQLIEGKLCWVFAQAEGGEKCRGEGWRAGDSDDKSPARTMWSWQYYILGLFHSRQG